MELCTVRHCSEIVLPFPQSIHVPETAPRHSPSISQSEKCQRSARGDALRILLWALEGADKSEIGANSKLVPYLADLVPYLADLVP